MTMLFYSIELQKKMKGKGDATHLLASPNVLFGSRYGRRDDYRSDATEKEKIASPGYFSD